MNILTNAVDALLDRSLRQGIAAELGQHPTSRSSKPRIIITTQVLPTCNKDAACRWVSIQIADNGPGLSASQREQVLASFSTEQRVVKETSLGIDLLQNWYCAMIKGFDFTN